MKHIDTAIELLILIQSTDARLRSINKEIREVYGDFATTLTSMPEKLESKVVELLDEILGDSVASYWLYECTGMKDGGFIQEKDGTKWLIKTVEDVRKYAIHIAKTRKK